ncbi:phosphatase [Gulosibacter molinativorax]|uniref:Phosphatase n=2 Tax=Gulosibacter molinativorax TaxID=256821 RepID=A0ABT7CAL3_9MICO|nr:phosphatase [Gulosibacter molinativorax]
MDGTLVDSNALVEQIWREFADVHGLDLTAILDYSHGRPSIDTVRRFLPDDEAEQWRWRDEVEAQGMARIDGIVEVPGAAEFIRRATASEIPFAVVTSAPRDLAVKRFGAAGVPFPELAVTADDITVGKPDPQPFALGAQLLRLPAAVCAAFEDSGAGLASARGAGAVTVVVGGYAGPEAAGLERIRHWHNVEIEPVNGAFRLYESA